MALIKVHDLQMDVAFACNLKCRGCTHYSNYANKGWVTIDTGGPWLEAWAKRLDPVQFCMLGGEPFLNPDLGEYARLAAKLWPDADRSIVTNGFFMKRQPGIYEILEETNTKLVVSIHSTDQAYIDKLMKEINLLDEARKKYDFEAEIRKGLLFYSTYKGEGKDMLPFAEKNPRAAWVACCNKECRTIHNGRLYKCPPIAFLDLIADRFGLHEKKEWRPYLAYEGVTPDITDAELFAFLAAQEEHICNMCPDHTRTPSGTAMITDRRQA